MNRREPEARLIDGSPIPVSEELVGLSPRDCKIPADPSAPLVAETCKMLLPIRPMIPLEIEIPCSYLPWEGDHGFQVLYFNQRDLLRVGGEPRLIREVSLLDKSDYYFDSSGCSWRVVDRAGRPTAKIAVILRSGTHSKLWNVVELEIRHCAKCAREKYWCRCDPDAPTD